MAIDWLAAYAAGVATIVGGNRSREGCRRSGFAYLGMPASFGNPRLARKRSV
jgi:hypothetical protein